MHENVALAKQSCVELADIDRITIECYDPFATAEV